jgi:hypothetical protein
LVEATVQLLALDAAGEHVHEDRRVDKLLPEPGVGDVGRSVCRCRSESQMGHKKPLITYTWVFVIVRADARLSSIIGLFLPWFRKGQE